MNSSGIRVGARRSQTYLPERGFSVQGPSEDDSEPHESTMHILIANQQSVLAIDSDRMRTVARQILEDAHFSSAALSIAIVDEATIRQLNRRYLRHDWPTDVLSFPLEERADYIEGEVVDSAEVAAKAAAEVPWPGTEELLLYVIHGTLHLVGYRDKQPEESAKMRAAERAYLQRVGVLVVAGDDRWQVVQHDGVFLGGLQTS